MLGTQTVKLKFMRNKNDEDTEELTKSSDAKQLFDARKFSEENAKKKEREDMVPMSKTVASGDGLRTATFCIPLWMCTISTRRHMSWRRRRQAWSRLTLSCQNLAILCIASAQLLSGSIHSHRGPMLSPSFRRHCSWLCHTPIRRLPVTAASSLLISQ